jgi:hypothetical protein
METAQQGQSTLGLHQLQRPYVAIYVSHNDQLNVAWSKRGTTELHWSSSLCQLLLTFMLQPASLKFTNFDLYCLAEGEDAGKLCLSLKGLFTDKSCKLLLDNPVLHDEEGFHTAIENLGNAFTAINLFLGIKKHLPSGWAGTILCRPAPEKVLRKLQKNANGSFVPCADLADNGALALIMPTWSLRTLLFAVASITLRDASLLE